MTAGPDSYASTDGGDSLWTVALRSLQGKLSALRLDDIASNTRLLERTESSLRVSASQSALASWLHDGRLSLLDAAVTEHSDGRADLALVPSPDAALADATQSLDRFIQSPANQVGYRAARSIAQELEPNDRTLLLHGPPGCGKTHLLRGIAIEWGRRRADTDVRCVDAGRVSLDLISALRRSELEAFRAPLRRCRLLLIDDVDTLTERRGTQEELAAILEIRVRTRSPVALTSSIPPERLAARSEPLQVQLRESRPAELRTPEWETRVAIILDRIALWQVETAPAVASFLVGRLGTQLGQLDGALTRLMTHPACARGLLDAELVQRILDNRRPLSASGDPQDVVRLVSQHFSVRPNELRSQDRSPRVCRPRQVAMYLLRYHCSLSYPQIGRRFRRHHTTAMYACKKIEAQRNEDSGLRAAVLLLEKELLQRSEDSG